MARVNGGVIVSDIFQNKPLRM